MTDILSNIKKNILDQNETIDMGFLGLPGAIDRGNCRGSGYRDRYHE